MGKLGSGHWYCNDNSFVITTKYQTLAVQLVANHNKLGYQLAAGDINGVNGHYNFGCLAEAIEFTQSQAIHCKSAHEVEHAYNARPEFDPDSTKEVKFRNSEWVARSNDVYLEDGRLFVYIQSKAYDSRIFNYLTIYSRKGTRELAKTEFNTLSKCFDFYHNKIEEKYMFEEITKEKINKEVKKLIASNLGNKLVK